jgi:hypothetical protein
MLISINMSAVMNGRIGQSLHRAFHAPLRHCVGCRPDAGAAARLAQAPGNATSGCCDAKANCAACHAIDAKRRKSPDLGAPKFETIANTPGMTGTARAAWLCSPHKNISQIVVRGDDHR